MQNLESIVSPILNKPKPKLKNKEEKIESTDKQQEKQAQNNGQSAGNAEEKMDVDSGTTQAE